MARNTSGMLFLRRDTEKMRAELADVATPTILRAVGDKWGAFFIESDDYTTEGVKAIYRQIANTIPMLHFAEAEDGRWEYTIFLDGAEVTHAELNGGAVDAAEGTKSTYAPESREQLMQRDLEAFQAFDLTTAQLNALQPYVAAEYDLGSGDAVTSGGFLSALELNGISGLSYESLSAAGESDNL